MRKIEIIYTDKGEHKSYLLSDGPFMIGRSSNCHVVNEHSSLDISVIIQQNDQGRVVVNSADEKVPFIVNERVVNNGIFNKDTFFKIGSREFWFSFTYEHENAPSSVDDLELPVNDFNHFDQDDFTEDTRKIVFIKKQETQEQDGVVAEKTIVEALETTEEQPLDMDDVFQFNTTFNEEGFSPVTDTQYDNESFVYDNYIELNEDIMLDEDKDDIARESEDHAVHVVYMNNGVVLNEDYFNFNTKKIYISNSVENRTTFKVHECAHSKSNLAYVRDGKVMINRQEGFFFHRSVLSGKMEEVDQDFIELHEGEKIIFTRGTTQVIITKDVMPPSLKKEKLFKTNTEVAKYVGSAWLMVFPLLFLLLLIEDQPEELPKKEVAIIYKLKKPDPVVKPMPKKEVVPEVAEVKPTPEPAKSKSESKQPLKPVKKKVTKTPPKKQTTALTPKKVTKKPQTIKSKSPKVAQTNKVKKSVKKYKFNTASKFNALMGNTLSTASTNQAADTKVSESIGKARDVASSSNVNLKSDLTEVSKLSTDGVFNGDTSSGVKGLSSKKGTNFAAVSSSAKILGAIDPEIVRKLLREHIPYFRSCYQKELRTKPNLNGVFDLNFMINNKGKGVKVKISTKKVRFSKTGVNCMQKVVSMIQFPKPKGGGFVEVRQPLNFFSNKL